MTYYIELNEIIVFSTTYTFIVASAKHLSCIYEPCIWKNQINYNCILCGSWIILIFKIESI